MDAETGALGGYAGDVERVGDSVYRVLRQRILTREIDGGTLLVEHRLVGELGVSRTPIHEALRRLTFDGLVQVSGRRRARVIRLSRNDVRELFRVRASLEQVAAESAARLIDPPSLDQLEIATDAMEQSVGTARGMRATFLAANAQFHAVILAQAQNKWLEMMLSPTLDILQGPMICAPEGHDPSEARWADVDSLKRFCDQHRQIIDAMRHRDAAWAGLVMNRHVVTVHGDWDEGTMADEAATPKRARRGKAVRRSNKDDVAE